MGLAIKGKEVIGLALNGKSILGAAKNGKVIWESFVAGTHSAVGTAIAAGRSLYDGIPSNGIMLYGDITGYSSPNPLGIQGDSINLKAPLSSCPNGIKIHFNTSSYGGGGEPGFDRYSTPDISIPKGSSSGSSNIISTYYQGSVKVIIKGSTLSFSINNASSNQNNKGTVFYVSGGYPSGILAITSITTY